MKKILFINKSKIWGGGEKWFFENALALTQNRYSIKIACLKNKPLYFKCFETNQNIILDLNNFILRDLIKIFSYKPDLIITNAGIDYRLASLYKLMNSKVKIIHRRGLDKGIKKNIINKIIFKYVINSVIANSYSTKSNILKTLPFLKNKIKVIYNGIKIAENNQETDVNFQKIIRKLNTQETLKIGIVGRLAKQKNHIFLFKSLEKICDKNWSLFIIGFGELEEDLKSYINNSVIKDKVIFLGFKENAESYVKLLDLIVMPSLYEGFGFSLVEAMLLKKPVIGTNISSIKELITPNENGFLIELDDTYNFAKKIQFFIDNRQECQKMGETGYKFSKKNFTFEKAQENLKLVIEGLI
jgi:glycosyltransferase involved in cell wall biosynthesis